LNIRPLKPADDDDFDHAASSAETPMRPDAFDMNDEDKINKIENHFREIMITLGLDLNDDSLAGTPRRVAKMFVKEAFSGLNPANKPIARLFDNKYNYDQMLVEKDITFYSHCEHHFVPIYGKAHVAYFSSGKVIGLSKINRIVQYFSKKYSTPNQLLW
jgi:GTP cyclohydrolase I